MTRRAVDDLVAARPEVDTVSPRTLPHRTLDVHWQCDNTVPTMFNHWLAGGGRDRCALGHYRAEHEGTFPILLRFGELGDVPNAAVRDLATEHAVAFERIVDRGICDGEAVEWSFYLHGASLDALARAGLRLDDAASSALFEAFREPLEALHASGWAHGGLTARRLRLVAIDEWYVEPKAPIRLCCYRGVPVSDELRAAELAVVAAAVDALRGGDADLSVMWWAAITLDPLIAR